VTVVVPIGHVPGTTAQLPLLSVPFNILRSSRQLVSASPRETGFSAQRAQATGICRAAQQSPQGMSAHARTRKSPVWP